MTVFTLIFVKKDARMTIRLAGDTKLAIEKAASQLDRSPNWLIVNILEKWLKSRKHRSD